MKPRVNRRTFLRNAVLGGTGLLILKNSHLTYSYESNEKLNIALIGVGGRGSWFVDAIPNLGQNIVAMCDVNDRKAELSFKAIPQAKKFHDFRKMLEQMNKDIDAVVIATPDHRHAVAAAAAMRASKGVYCEKPLTHNIREARTLCELAARYKVATQMSNQGTSSEGFRQSIITWSMRINLKIIGAYAELISVGPRTYASLSAYQQLVSTMRLHRTNCPAFKDSLLLIPLSSKNRSSGLALLCVKPTPIQSSALFLNGDTRVSIFADNL